MKSSFWWSISLLKALCLQADEVDEVRKAFATFHEYQKSDDIRVLDLFTTNCTATFIVATPTRRSTNVLSGDEFRAELSRQLSLKQGNSDVYEGVRVAKTGDSFLLKCKVQSASPGRQGDLSMSYVRDTQGAVRIREMTIVVHPVSLKNDAVPSP